MRNRGFCKSALWLMVGILVVVSQLSVLQPNLQPKKHQSLQQVQPPQRGDDGDGDGEKGVRQLCPHYRPHPSHLPLRWDPHKEDEIFFIDTSCAIAFTGRQACAVEAAARHNPNTSVILYITAPSVNHTQPLLQVLRELQNVRLVWFDLDQVFSDAPLNLWYQHREWLYNEERVPLHVNDAGRSEVLRRYGGTYLDLDTILMRHLPDSPDNYIGRLDENQIGGGVMSFRKHHPLFQKVVEDIPEVFEPLDCCTIGPLLLMKCLKTLCPGNLTSDLTVGSYSANLTQNEICADVTIFPIGAFYPISFGLGRDERFKMLRTGIGLGRRFLEESEAHALHLFNSLTGRRKVILGGDSIMEEVAKRNCPAVYKILKETINFF